MSHQSDVRIELTTSHEDWVLVRECYVQSFHRYPLYKYMVPDDNKRDAFLRAYLDANYDVTVASGKGILLRIGMPNGDRNNNKSSSGTGCARTSMKIIGGVVFVPPSDDGHGWAITDDEPYWEAYEKYGLAKISPDGLERVKRYEAWENENICKKLSGSRIPMWNGLFCAISPEYSSKGLGSTVYKEAIRIMAQYWVKQQQPKKAQLHRIRPQSERSISLESNNQGFVGKILRSFSLKEIHRCALLSHRALPQAAFMQKLKSPPQTNATKLPGKACTNQTTAAAIQPRDIIGSSSAPLVVAISHSDRAAHFHKANGFHPIARTPYHDPVEGNTPFYTHVLVLDPFRTGRVNELGSSLETPQNSFNPLTLPSIVA